MSTSSAATTSAASEHLWSMMSSHSENWRDQADGDRLAAITFIGQTSPPGPEIAGVRGRLVFARRHQIAITGEEVEFLADNDVIVVLAALILRPEGAALAPECLQHRPWPGQRVVHGGDLITKQVLVLLVECDALVDNRVVVPMKRDAARFVDAWALDVAGLDFERIEATVVVGVEPFADRIAGPGGFLVLGKPRPSV